ncbi:MAG TPA: phage integrase N-terminal SAM-like domain-containing protein [Anaerolineaceae bacterium]|nr:phage integrase N-terminal SAM-like domain-containing protein [Anaerolineaceae bacterium]
MDSSSDRLSAHITENTLLPPAIQAWKIYLHDQGRTNNTLKAFSADLSLLADFLPADKPLGQITTKDLEDFLEWLQNDRNVPCSPKTLSRRITSIKSFFRWLTVNGVLSHNPAEKIVQKTVVSPLPEVLTAAEQEKVLDAAEAMRTAANPDLRPYVLLRLLLETGLKKGECLHLMTNHVELEGPEAPRIFVRYSSPRYRYKERNIPVSPEWAEAYQEYIQRYEIKNQVFPWSQRRLEYLLEDVGNAAGLEKHLSFDMCRWTSALNDLTAGIDTDKIRQKLGISKIQWREVYAKLHSLAKELGYELSSTSAAEALD